MNKSLKTRQNISILKARNSAILFIRVIKNRVIFKIRAKKLTKDSIVDCILTRFAEFSIKNYIYSEISS